nr:MAG TPA: hypothetical protein [Bacteriophage sp.]
MQVGLPKSRRVVLCSQSLVSILKTMHLRT